MSKFVEWFQRYGSALLASVALVVASLSTDELTITQAGVEAGTISADADGVTIDAVGDLLLDAADTLVVTAGNGATVDGVGLNAGVASVEYIRADAATGGAAEIDFTSQSNAIFLTASFGVYGATGTNLNWSGAGSFGALSGSWATSAEQGRTPVQEYGGSQYPNAAPGATAETVMVTRGLTTGSLTSSGVIVVEAWGIAAANTNSKIVRLRYGATSSGTGGTAVGACTFASASDTTWRATWTIQRSGTDTQRLHATCDGAATDAQSTSTGAIDDGAAIDLNLTVQNATSAGDLTVHGMTLVYYP